MDEIDIFFDLSIFIRRDREQRRDREEERQQGEVIYDNIILIIKYLVSLKSKSLNYRTARITI